MLGLLWAVIKVFQVVFSDSSFESAQALDITNPSLFGILGFNSLIAYFVVRPKRKPPTPSTAASHAPASKTTCDQCGMSFPSGYYLAKSSDDRYLCESCRPS